MELFGKQSGCPFPLPPGVTPLTGECQTFPDTDPSTAFGSPDQVWDDLEGYYANVCSCTSDDCNLEDMDKCTDAGKYVLSPL